jgi:hypothetical protein
MPVFWPELVSAFIKPCKKRRDRGMLDRLVGVVDDQVLLADISDVAAVRILGEQVIERLILGRPLGLGNRFVPFVAVGELRIDIVDDAAEIEQAVADDLADCEARQWDHREVRRGHGVETLGILHGCNLVIAKG